MIVFLNIFIFIGWLIIGLTNLCGDWRAVRKFDYGLCWTLLMLNLLMNLLRSLLV